MNYQKLRALGWGAGIATAVFWALYALVMRIGIVSAENIHPLSFILQAMVSGALVLLLVSGPGRLSTSTMRNSHTWLYGTLQIVNNVVLMAAFTFAITATSATLFLRVGIIISVIMNLVFRGQHRISSVLGFVAIVAGVAVVATGVDADPMALIFVFVSALAQVCQTFISEDHHQSNAASGNIKSECRVTGYIMAVTATIYSLFLYVAVSVMAGENALLGILPTQAELYSTESLILAGITGALIFAPMTFFKFVSTKSIGNHNFLVAVAFTPLLTYVFEMVFELVRGGVLPALSPYEMFGIIAISGGSILTARASKKNKGGLNDKILQYNVATKERVLAAIGHFEGNVLKAADSLGVSVNLLRDIVAGERLATPEQVKIIQLNYDSYIRDQDPVTGLDNRKMFMAEITKLEYANIAFTLVFIDLDKFKEVNDTYGHAVGDKVLAKVAERLQANYSHIASITRLGGDEFCLAFHNINKAQVEECLPDIHALIAEPMTFEKLDTLIRVGSSVGVASFPEDGKNVQEVLNRADENMYCDKVLEAK